MKNEPTVFIVDDDPGIRRALRMLMKSVGLPCETFESGPDFLEVFDPSRAGCLVLDVRMPGMSGLELQEKLATSGKTTPPIVFMTAHGDVPMAVSAMKSGALDFIQKPFRDQEMIDRIQKALALDREMRSESSGKEVVLERIERLTPREREVLDLIVEGKPNKGIAFDLGVSERTVEIHRSRVMRKMEAESLAELVQMVLRVR
ncbi:MAG: response regulator transcription factor [Candidatus Eisenbacteria bacterium]|uniref:Response regulator transcription factor n=1 Tax=Eiseniibacteriota bacterium TaxID=2212470 RepID=A0A956RNN3_UNCEI|nr:response regulator transcription factor [Candidatus Eisenbacteria bacterium]